MKREGTIIQPSKTIAGLTKTAALCLAAWCWTGALRADKLFYKWKSAGKEVKGDNEDAENVIETRVKARGYVIFDYDPAADEFARSQIMYIWKEKGKKVLYYCFQKYLNNNYYVRRKNTRRGDLIEITAIGENILGYVKKDLVLKSSGKTYRLPKTFKGKSVYKKIYFTDDTSSANIVRFGVGEAKISLKLDLKRTDLANAADGKIDNQEIVRLIFGNKPHEAGKLPYAISWWQRGGDAAANGWLFEKLAVGTEDSYYMFPSVDGEQYAVLSTDGAGQLYWRQLESRDAYLLARKNHTGTIPSTVISDFAARVKELVGDPVVLDGLDMQEFLKLLDAWAAANADLFSKYLTHNLDVTKIISRFDETDIRKLRELLKVDSLTRETILAGLGYTPVDQDQLAELVTAVDQVKANTAKHSYPPAHQEAMGHIVAGLTGPGARDLDLVSMADDLDSLKTKLDKLDKIDINTGGPNIDLNTMRNDVDALQNTAAGLNAADVHNNKLKLNAIWQCLGDGVPLNQANLRARGWP